MTAFGFRYYKRGWRVFSQMLTAGGILLLYLAAYASFGYYQLVPQKSAFAFLVILVAQAAALALLYDAPAIAIMAIVGGFFVPVLLRSEQDQYRTLFAYVLAIDAGAIAILKNWRGLNSVTFAGTHLLFWLWYAGNYHPAKRRAVLLFQAAVFLIFLLAHIGRRILKRRPATFEHLGLLLLNPFVFFATEYHLLNPHRHDWMGVFAIGMALVYAGGAKLVLSRSSEARSEILTMIGVALMFVTIAIPIQLEANWITIAWSVEAVVILWAGLETGNRGLSAAGVALFGLALMRLVFVDTVTLDRVAVFTPVLNKYFLSSLSVTACLFGAAAICRRGDEGRRLTQVKTLAFVLGGIVTMWFVMTTEVYTYFTARALAQKLSEDASHERWLGQMALSVLWSVYAAALMAAGFLRRAAGVRWAALALFGVTVIKVMLVDIARLQQLYRVIAFLVLGLLLLSVAWGYQRAFHSRESSE